MAFDSKAFLASLVAMAGLNLAQDMDEEDQAKQVENYVKNMKDGCAKKTADLTASLSLARNELDAVRRASGVQTRDPEVLQLSRENRQNKIDGLVARGKISPKVAEGLAAQFVGDDQALALSLNPQGRASFEAVVKALEHNDPKELTERTGAQVQGGLLLARPNSPDGVDPDLKARTAAAYGKPA